MQFISPIARAVRKLVSLAAAGAIALSLTFGVASNALADPTAQDTITVNGEIIPTITLILPQASFDYGDLTPNLTGSVLGASVTGIYDGTTGSTYTYTAAGVVRVQSNDAWNGDVSAVQTGTSTLDIGDFSLVSGGTPTAFGAALPLLNTGAGVFTYTHDYSVRIEWTDETTLFGATITYSVTNA